MRRKSRRTGHRATIEKEIDVRDWLSRAEAAKFAAVTINTIINWQAKRKLHPVADYRRDRGGAERRQWVYDPAELLKLRRPEVAMRSRDPGETAARAFELFEAGRSDAAIVIALRESPDNVTALREKWLGMGGNELVIHPVARRALEELVGPFSDVTHLVELVGELKRKAI